MGLWGIELYQNDTSLDVKNQFEEQFNNGKKAEDITSQMVEDFSCLMGNPIEEPLFWISLADTQWNLGTLLPHVREKALLWIQKCSDTRKWQEEDPETTERRRKTLDILRCKLLSPQPVIKKPSKKRFYTCPWKLGDVFAYRLESNLAKEKGLLGRYFLIQKVDESVWHPGHIVPIVYVKITENERLPSSAEEYDRLEYVQTWFTKYEERFWPINGSRPEEDIAEKSKICYEVDEFGFLPQFRITLVNTSKKSIPPKLIYLGNFEGAHCPQKEFVPHSKANITSVFWKKFDETFETKMIKRYCGHNLREFEIYKKTD